MNPVRVPTTINKSSSEDKFGYSKYILTTIIRLAITLVIEIMNYV